MPCVVRNSGQVKWMRACRRDEGIIRVIETEDADAFLSAPE